MHQITDTVAVGNIYDAERPPATIGALLLVAQELSMPQHRVMVCCRAGMGRSVSVVMAYLCCVQGMAYPDVWTLAMTRRPGAVPLPNLRATIEQVRELRKTRKATHVPSLE